MNTILDAIISVSSGSSQAKFLKETKSLKMEVSANHILVPFFCVCAACQGELRTEWQKCSPPSWLAASLACTHGYVDDEQSPLCVCVCGEREKV